MGRSRLPASIRALIPVELDTRPRAERMALILPFPPSVNNLYPTILVAGKPRRIKSALGKRYEASVRTVVGLWINSHQMQPPLPPYVLSLRVYPPQDGHKHDASNLVKCPEDAVMAAIGGDDNDVELLHVVKMPPDPYPRIELVLETATASATSASQEES